MPALDPAAFQARVASGAIPVDLRTPGAFLGGHVPGAIFLQFGRHDLGVRARGILPEDGTFVLVMEPAVLGPAAEKLLGDAGYAVAGHLAFGMAAWEATGLPVERVETIPVAALRVQLPANTLGVLDVREPHEYAHGRIPGARLLPHGDTWQWARDLDPNGRWVLACRSQRRSSTAASILRRLGFRDVAVVEGGTAAWLSAGFPVDRGEPG